MKTVISDTSPISFLLLIGEIEILPKIFGEIVVPPAVLVELQHFQAPAVVRDWARQPPPWVTESSPHHLLYGLNLDLGETEAISLASEYPDSLLIIDEFKGRQAAVRHGIRITGTVGILEEAAVRGLLDFEITAQKLMATNFRVSQIVLAAAAERVRKRASP